MKILHGLFALTLAGCPSSGSSSSSSSASTSSAATSAATPTGSASTSASAQPSSSSPVPKPTATPYSGPSGTITGIVRVTGDDPPLTNHQYPKDCEGASGVYGKLFRVGQDGQLADALVMVTNYGSHHVPPTTDAIKLTINDCAYNTRTVGMTDGQFLEVRNLDVRTSFVPHLDGARLPATNVAVPRGPAIKLFSRGRGRYWLRDQMGKPFQVVHVFHFPYATHDVTGLDGRYSIAGIPVGKAKVSVMLPQTKTMKSISKDIEVKQGDNVIDLELAFDAKADTPDDGHGGTKPSRK